MSGNDFKIMWFTMTERLSLDAYVTALLEQYGKGKAEVSAVSRKLGGREYSGKKLMVTLAGNAFSQEIYSFSGKAGSRFLVLQDTPAEGKSGSAEGAAAAKVLADSFKDTASK